MWDEVVSLVGALAAICAVLALAYLFTRYVVGRTALPRGLRQRHMVLLEQLPVGKDRALLLVQVGERIYLLGAAPGGVTCLETIPEEEAAQWRAEPAEGAAQGTSFQAALRDVLRQRKS